MGAGTRERSVGARAFAVSISVHALVLALVLGAPSPVRPAWTPVASSLVDVALVDQPPSEPGGSTMPALPNALSSPVIVEGERTRDPSSPAVERRRTLAPRVAPTADVASTRASLPRASSAAVPDEEAEAPSTAPSSVDESTRSATDTGNGSGEGAGAGDSAQLSNAGESATAHAPALAAAAPEAADRCGDPINGEWRGVGHHPIGDGHFGWHALMLRLERVRGAIVGSLTSHHWTSRGADPVVPRCRPGEDVDETFRVGLSGSARGSRYSLQSTGGRAEDAEGPCLLRGGTGDLEWLMVPGRIQAWLRSTTPDHAELTVEFGYAIVRMELHRRGCLDAPSE